MTSTNTKKLIAIVVAALISLSGCTAKEEQKETEVSIDKTIEQLAEETGLSKTEITAAINESLNEDESINEIKDEATTVQYFEDQQIDLALAISTQNKEEIKEKTTEYMKNVVDFVFNNKEVNGITFSSLSNDAKAEITESITTTNNMLEESGIKDITITAASDAKVWTLKTLKEASIISKIALQELMSEESYNKAAEIVDTTKIKVINAYDAVKEYLNNK